MVLLFGTLALLLEAVAWVALARWGWTAHPLLGFTYPLAFTVVWGLLLSPKANYGLPPIPKAALQIVLFGIAAYGAGQVWSQTFAVTFFASAFATILTVPFLNLPRGVTA